LKIGQLHTNFKVGNENAIDPSKKSENKKKYSDNEQWIAVRGFVFRHFGAVFNEVNTIGLKVPELPNI